MDVCIGASCGSLMPILRIILGNVLSLVGLHFKISLCGINSKYIPRSYILSENLARIPTIDPYFCAMVFIDIKVYSNSLCQQSWLLHARIDVTKTFRTC